jgi:hypothetical protein
MPVAVRVRSSGNGSESMFNEVARGVRPVQSEPLAELYRRALHAHEKLTRPSAFWTNLALVTPLHVPESMMTPAWFPLTEEDALTMVNLTPVEESDDEAW